MLAASGYFRRDLIGHEAAAHLGNNATHVRFALGRSSRNHVVDLGIALRVQRGEGEVLQLLADLLHAESVGKRRVDVQRLGRYALLLFGRQRRQGAHVVQAVGELDDQHAGIACHGDEHLSHGGGLLLLLRVEAEALELCHAVDQHGNLGTELLLDVAEADRGVLDDVVDQ